MAARTRCPPTGCRQVRSPGRCWPSALYAARSETLSFICVAQQPSDLNLTDHVAQSGNRCLLRAVGVSDLLAHAPAHWPALGITHLNR